MDCNLNLMREMKLERREKRMPSREKAAWLRETAYEGCDNLFLWSSLSQLINLSVCDIPREICWLFSWCEGWETGEREEKWPPPLWREGEREAFSTLSCRKYLYLREMRVKEREERKTSCNSDREERKLKENRRQYALAERNSCWRKSCRNDRREGKILKAVSACSNGARKTISKVLKIWNHGAKTDEEGEECGVKAWRYQAEGEAAAKKAKIRKSWRRHPANCHEENSARWRASSLKEAQRNMKRNLKEIENIWRLWKKKKNWRNGWKYESYRRKRENRKLNGSWRWWLAQLGEEIERKDEGIGEACRKLCSQYIEAAKTCENKCNQAKKKTEESVRKRCISICSIEEKIGEKKAIWLSVRKCKLNLPIPDWPLPCEEGFSEREEKVESYPCRKRKRNTFWRLF